MTDASNGCTRVQPYLVFSLRNCHAMSMAVIIVARASEVGNDIQTPSSPKIRGKYIRSGIMNIT